MTRVAATWSHLGRHAQGKQVVAIDPSRRELEEAADGPLKIVMDARDMLFLDDTVDVVTPFFTLMYIQASDRKKVLEAES